MSNSISSSESRGVRRRRERKEKWQEKQDETESLWGDAWYRYREAFSVIPPPSALSAEENEGAIGMGLVRIPALVVYTPLYYLLLFGLAIPMFPVMLIVTATDPNRR